LRKGLPALRRKDFSEHPLGGEGEGENGEPGKKGRERKAFGMADNRYGVRKKGVAEDDCVIKKRLNLFEAKGKGGGLEEGGTKRKLAEKGEDRLGGGSPENWLKKGGVEKVPSVKKPLYRNCQKKNT